MKLIKPFSCSIFVAAIMLGLCIGAANAAPPRVSNIYVPLQGTVALSNDEVVNFTGQVHVLTRVTFSDTFVPAVQMYVNLIGVRGRVQRETISCW